MAKIKNKIADAINLEAQAKKDAERNELFQRLNENKGQQQIVDESGELSAKNELIQFKLQDTDDPEKKHDYYYKGIERLLKQIADPKKDKDMKEAFKVLREEKNIFLNRGKRLDDKGIRHGDARMAYISDMEIALNIISGCILSGGTPLELYTAFRDKNIELGYYKFLESAHSTTVRDNEDLNEVYENMKSKK